MPVPFLSSITLNKNEVQDFKVFNVGTGNPTLSSGGDIGYFWTDTTGSKVLKWWDGSAVRTLLDSSSTTIVAADLSGGAAGSLPYQQGASDTTFLGIGTANQVLKVNSGATAPEWTSQSNLSVGTATFLAGGTAGDIPVQSAAGTTGFLNIGANGRILTSNGTTPVWSASIPSSSVSGLAASATTDTTNASNISSGTLPLARLALANGSLYVGDASGNPEAKAKNLIPLSGFGAAGADVAMGGFKITGLADPVDQTDAATRKYVDEVAQGLDVKASCLTATTANIDLSAPTASIGGVTISTVDSRVLVKDQTDKKQNGIYLWKGAAVAMTRSLDADTVAKLVGAFTFVEQGTNADSGWVCQVDGGTIGSVDIEWTKFSQAGSYTAGNGMVLSGGVFHFAQSSAYTAGQIPFAGGTLGTSSTSIGFDSNFVWDDQANRLGIGTATPAYPLSVNGRISYSGAIGEGADTTLSSSGTVLLHGNSSTWTEQRSYTGGTERLRIDSSGVCTWSNVGGVAGTAMTLNGTGLGIGASPSSRLTVTSTGSSGNSTIESSPIRTNVGGTLSCFIGHDTTANRPFIQASTGNAGTASWDLLIQPYGGNVAIGQTSSTSRLTVQTASFNDLGISSSNVPIYSKTYGGTTSLTRNLLIGHCYTESNTAFSNTQIALISSNNTAAQSAAIGLTSDNALALYTNGGNAAADSIVGTERLRIDSSGNVGIGTTTPAYTLDVNGTARIGTVATAGRSALLFSSGASNFTIEQTNKGSGGHVFLFKLPGWTSDAFVWNRGSTQLATLNGDGNLGLGVTPSAWGSGYKALQIAANGANLTGDVNYQYVYLGVNNYHNGSSWQRVAAGYATRYSQGDGAHIWYTAPNASGAINPWTQAMTLDASGRLMVGTASPLGVVTAYSAVGTLPTIGDSGSTNIATVSGGSLTGTTLVSGRYATTLVVQSNTDSFAAGTGASIGFQAKWASSAYSSAAQFASIFGGKENGTDSNLAGYFSIATRPAGGDPTERLRIKSTGQLNFVGLASDPAGAAGDVVYNSTSNRLKYHNGTAWVNTGTNKYSGALAGSGTSFTVTHNLGTRDVTVAVRKSGSTYDQVFTDVQMTTDNTVTIVFASSVTGSDYTVTVIG